MFENKKKERWKNFRLPFCSFFWPFCRALFIYYGKSWNGKKYQFANVKSFCYLIWIFFLSFVYTSTKGMEKVQSSKKLVNQKICKWILNCHFKFWHNRRNGFLSEPDSKLNSNPFFILFIADLIYHLSLTPPGPHCTA